MQMILLIVYIITGGNSIDLNSTFSIIRRITSVGSSMSTNILGFLVGGFAILTALLNPRFLLSLAKIPSRQDKKINRMQYILYAYLFVFAHYIAFLIVTTMISIALPDGTTWLNERWHRPVIAYGLWLASALSAWTLYVLLLLKSFVWSIYTTTLLHVASHEMMERMDDVSLSASSGILKAYLKR
ncbi:hypothetical protein [Prosthecomicrobium sp. N25]|uniref:hypothetical protein n=1 Tax=Prosthecomicrobium sp. N25 TaxID=3129254 RepID=UPI00307691F0